MNEDKKIQFLRKAIREIIESELDEMSTTAAAPGYMTPKAFSNKKRKKLIKKCIKEGRYHKFRNNPDKNSVQKIGTSIREIKKSLKEINSQMAILTRYKNEVGQNYDSYWKRTLKDIYAIESNILKLSKSIRELKT